MDEFWRGHIPAFGSWDCNDEYGVPFTQCFDSARQAGLLRYTSYSDDRDLYVAGDLYENDVVTPAMIVVPRRKAKSCYRDVKGVEKAEWMVCGDVKEPPSPVSPPPPPRKAPKAVDEDLYKISPELLLHAKPKRLLLYLYGTKHITVVDFLKSTCHRRGECWASFQAAGCQPVLNEIFEDHI